MSQVQRDIEKREGSASEAETEKVEPSRTAIPRDIDIINDINLERSIRRGLRAPFSRVLFRLLLATLIVSSLAMFFTGIMKYNELMREKEILEQKKEVLEDEIAELKYLIDCPVDYDYIVRVAREKLGLHLPDEIVYYNDAAE